MTDLHPAEIYDMGEDSYLAHVLTEAKAPQAALQPQPIEEERG